MLQPYWSKHLCPGSDVPLRWDFKVGSDAAFPKRGDEQGLGRHPRCGWRKRKEPAMTRVSEPAEAVQRILEEEAMRLTGP